MLTQYASWTPALPGHQVVLGAADVALRQATHRHRSAEVHVHSAKVLTEDPPGLQQTLRERERERQYCTWSRLFSQSEEIIITVQCVWSKRWSLTSSGIGHLLNFITRYKYSVIE